MGDKYSITMNMMNTLHLKIKTVKGVSRYGKNVQGGTLLGTWGRNDHKLRFHWCDYQGTKTYVLPLPAL